MGEEEKLDSLSVSKVIVFTLIGIVYYLIRRDSGEYYMSKPIMEILVFSFFVVAGQTILWWSRYYMPHVTVNGASHSILGRPIVLQDKDKSEWLVFNCGESLEPFHFRGKLGTLVVPKPSMKRAGRNYVGLPFVKRTPVLALPKVVSRYLFRNKDQYNIEKIMFGRYTEEFLIDNPQIPDFEDVRENLLTQINLLTRVIEGNNDHLLEMMEMARSITGEKKKWYQVFKKDEEKVQE